MKRLSLYLFLILFTLQTPSQADDIRDFQIEGMSIGDSLLDYISEQEIEEKKNSFRDKGYLYSSKKFYSLTFDKFPTLKQYDQLQFHLKDKDKSYKIYSFTGIQLFRNNIKNCYKVLDKVELELDNLLTNAKKEKNENAKHSSGKGVSTNIWYFYKSGSNIFAACEDWTEESNIPDDLAIAINSKEFQYFIDNEAFK